MTILREVAQVAEASMADLVETYNALSGKSIKKFESLEIARRRVENQMLINKSADAQTGVPRGTDGVVKTAEELAAKVEAKGGEPEKVADMVSDGKDEDTRPNFAMGTMAAQLQEQADKRPKVEPKPKAPKGEGKKAAPIVAVRATFAGKSKGQPGSQRTAVLLKVQASPDSCALVEDLDKHFDGPTRGHIQKLIDVGHLVLIPEDEAKAAKEQKLPARKPPEAPAQADPQTQPAASA